MGRILYACTIEHNADSGAGLVGLHEVAAIRSAFIDDELNIWDKNSIMDFSPGRPMPSPDAPDACLNDYMTMYNFHDIDHDFRFVHFNGGAFWLSANMFRDKGAKIICTASTHNWDISMDELKKFAPRVRYPYLFSKKYTSLLCRHVAEADLILCPSTLAAENCKQFIQPKVEPTIVSYGTDVVAASPMPDKFSVAYTGASGPDKGVIYLIAAWERFMKDGAHRKSRLILGGDSPRRYTELIKLVCDKLDGYWPPYGNYDPIGYVPDVSEIYDKCSIYVQPSVTEGFGLEVLEAMMRGRPVIVSEGVGAVELIEDEVNGFRVPIQDVYAICDKIEELYDSPELLKSMGNAARETAMKYDWATMETKYEEIYKGLVYG